MHAGYGYGCDLRLKGESFETQRAQKCGDIKTLPTFVFFFFFAAFWKCNIVAAFSGNLESLNLG